MLLSQGVVNAMRMTLLCAANGIGLMKNDELWQLAKSG